MFFFLQAQVYTLESYLSKVSEHPLLQANETSLKTSMNLTREASLLTSPSLDIEMIKTHSKDNLLYLSEKDSLKGKLSLSYPTPLGVNGEISYEPNKISLKDENPLKPIDQSTYENILKIGLNTSLTRNFLGSRIRLQKKKIASYQSLNHLRNTLNSKKFLNEAEETYIKLFLSQEKLNIIEESLKKAESLYAQYLRKRRSNLIDQSDVLQTSVLKERYAMEKELEEENQKNLLRDFSYFIQKDFSHDIQLSSINWSKYFEESFAYKKHNLFKKIKSEEIQMLKTDFQLKKKELYPEVSLSGGLSWTSYQNKLSDSLALKDASPGYFFKVNFSIPLFQRDVFLLQESLTHELYRSEKSFFDLDQKDEKDFLNLLQTFLSLKKSLKILTEMKDIQKNRLTLEKEKLRYGTSTSFQVYMIEQEYFQSRLKELEFFEKITKLKFNLRDYQ